MPHGLVIPPVGSIPGAPGPGQGGAPQPISPFRRFTGRAPTSLDALRLLQAGGTQAESKRLLREAAGLPQQRQGVGTFGGVASTQPVGPNRGAGGGPGGTRDIFINPPGTIDPGRARPSRPTSGGISGSRPTSFYDAFLRRPEQFKRPASAGRQQTRASINALGSPF